MKKSEKTIQEQEAVLSWNRFTEFKNELYTKEFEEVFKKYGDSFIFNYAYPTSTVEFKTNSEGEAYLFYWVMKQSGLPLLKDADKMGPDMEPIYFEIIQTLTSYPEAKQGVR